jgi:hypothetical protein
MKRTLWFALLLAAGCTAPSSETVQSSLLKPPPPCFDEPPGSIPVPVTLGIDSSTPDPWGKHTGTIVVQSTPGAATPYFLWGVDSATGNVDWFMASANDADLARLESYPQSRRSCAQLEHTPGAGSSPSNPPDPWDLGNVCAPPNLAGAAASSYMWGYDQSLVDYDTAVVLADDHQSDCQSYGTGGCVPLAAADCASHAASCGSIPDGCGGWVYCGTCGPSYYCGLNTPNQCSYCRPHCPAHGCGADDGCGGTCWSKGCPLPQ